jgi:hypothetical protein
MENLAYFLLPKNSIGNTEDRIQKSGDRRHTEYKKIGVTSRE